MISSEAAPGEYEFDIIALASVSDYSTLPGGKTLLVPPDEEDNSLQNLYSEMPTSGSAVKKTTGRRAPPKPPGLSHSTDS